MIITLVSPDKLTLSMFADFYKSCFCSTVEILDLNNLYSREAQDQFMDELLRRDNDRAAFLIKYKTKKSPEEIQVPESLVEGSSYMLTFEMLSMEPGIIRQAKPEYLEEVLKRWKMNIERMDKV